ncbi:MAG: TauD/TfdA family dioxygenase [Novosphingobium sp.]|nr:TauD/TfdA family dioxygenase [Novosphingobium sp.]MCP5402370.1 TauD/TfdA family dioxygenase [Novosphingobium sp.]
MSATIDTIGGKTLDIKPISPALGAEVYGVDLGQPLSDEIIAEIRAAVVQFKVIFFRDQDITQDQHVELGRRFGELEVHPSTTEDQPHPEILHLISGAKTTLRADIWHSDVTYRAIPSFGSILRARVVPPVGGDTLFCNMALAYEGLSPKMKEFVCSLTAVHDILASGRTDGVDVEKVRREYPVQEHPVVRTHPETGERAIFVNRAFTREIKGLSRKESDWLIDHLCSLTGVPEYQCRFRWQKNSIAFWDNRVTQHYASTDYLPADRHMERVTIIGEKPYFEP